MLLSQDSVIATIPSYLRQFVVKQHYDQYTPQDHAVWRYIMRRNVAFLNDVAHPAYLEGLQHTGIRLDRIPNIDEMNACLANLGWRAVVVDGFVPPAAFMEFQAHRILVISAEIRNARNIRYTPAPDIVHEAAGHAPLIADPIYADFLVRTGRYGAKTVFSALDYDIYEAIRAVSILKEFPDASPHDIRLAEEHLESKQRENTTPSEAALLARLHWWTVEYGLVGTPENFRIFGAGLLSSVGESKACLQPQVRKIPLSVECTSTDYDITHMQPQLFVAHDFSHLIDVLETFADQMCFRRGGLYALDQLIQSRNVGTIELSSGLQISGRFIKPAVPLPNIATFLTLEGPVSLAVGDKQLDGHGSTYHHHGFSSPIGRIAGTNVPLELFRDEELHNFNLITGQTVALPFESGFHLNGSLVHIHRHNAKIILLTFENCSIVAPNGELVYKPEWGPFDLAVGEQILSGYSGSADKEAFNVYPPKSERNAIKPIYTEAQNNLFKLYQAANDPTSPTLTELHRINEVIRNQYPDDWLLRLELLQILKKIKVNDTLSEQVTQDLISAQQSSADAELIEVGLQLL